MKNYYLSNHINNELQSLEMSNIYGLSIDTLNRQLRQGWLKDSRKNTIFGHFKAKQINKRLINNIKSLLYGNSVDNHTKLYFYYVVSSLKDTNENVIRDKNDRYGGLLEIKTQEDQNPYIELKHLYNGLKNKFTKCNRNYKSNYINILREHQETVNTNKLNNHSNIIIISTKLLNENSVKSIIQNQIPDYLDIKIKRLKTKKDLIKVINYSTSTLSQLPYCKHIKQGKTELHKIKSLSKNELHNYLYAILNSSKGVQLQHTLQFRTLLNHINKVSKVRKSIKKEQINRNFETENALILSQRIIFNDLNNNKKKSALIKKQTKRENLKNARKNINQVIIRQKEVHNSQNSQQLHNNLTYQYSAEISKNKKTHFHNKYSYKYTTSGIPP